MVDGVYEPIVIETLGDDRLRGYSDALGLYVCWEAGMLRFFDPGTESYLDTHEEERAGRLAAQARANTAETRAEEERTGREAAESRLAELEAELRRLRNE